MEGHKGKAIRERAEGPKAPRIRGRESPFERRQAGEIPIHRPARDFLIRASQSFRPLLAPEIKIVLVLLSKPGDRRRANGVPDFLAAFH